MMQRAVAFAGYSDSGKTTLICRLIEHFKSLGVEVAAIKHTHHALDSLDSEGDTARFLRAGASSAILAGTGEAIVFRPASDAILPVRFAWKKPSDLTSRTDGALLMIEGFKSLEAWPKVLVGLPGSAVPPPDATVIACVGASLAGVPNFTHDDIDGLAGFLDRILER